MTTNILNTLPANVACAIKAMNWLEADTATELAKTIAARPDDANALLFLQQKLADQVVVLTSAVPGTHQAGCNGTLWDVSATLAAISAADLTEAEHILSGISSSIVMQGYPFVPLSLESEPAYFKDLMESPTRFLEEAKSKLSPHVYKALYAWLRYTKQALTNMLVRNNAPTYRKSIIQAFMAMDCPIQAACAAVCTINIADLRSIQPILVEAARLYPQVKAGKDTQLPERPTCGSPEQILQEARAAWRNAACNMVQITPALHDLMTHIAQVHLNLS